MTQAIYNTQGGPSGLPLIIQDAPLNSKDVLRIELSEYQGRAVVGARKYYRDTEGELRPSSKGLTLAISKLPLLAEGIAAALVKARQLGLLDGGGDG